MMERSMLSVGALATAGFIASAVLGYRLAGPADPGMPGHVLAALISSLLVLFSHCWIVLYLLGTGKAIRSAVALDPSLPARTRRLKTSSFPFVLTAMVLVLATFVFGGAVAANAQPSSVHHALFYAAVVVQGAALWMEWRVLGENERLLADADRRLAEAAASPVA